MKKNKTISTIILVIVIVILSYFVLPYYSNYRDGLYKAIREMDLHEKELDIIYSKDEQKEDSYHFLEIYKYKKFFKNEFDTIFNAALRNDCVGENFVILLAIRKIENGATRQFGIIHPKCEKIMKARPNDTLDIQAGWAAATIVKNKRRWNRNFENCNTKYKDFIEFLGSRYCPTGTDFPAINNNWIPNIRFWIKKLNKEYEND